MRHCRVAVACTVMFVVVQLAPPGDTSGEDLPPCQLPPFDHNDRGPVMPVPRGIRPTLSKHRIEVRTTFPLTFPIFQRCTSLVLPVCSCHCRRTLSPETLTASNATIKV